MVDRGFSLAEYDELGYTGPTQVLTADEARAYYNFFFAGLGQDPSSPGPPRIRLSSWHHKHRWAYDLATHPKVVEHLARKLGPDLVLWAMHFWYKEPGNRQYIPWHQDRNYWPMEPEINMTAWLSLSPCFKENGCLRLIPGSHGEEIEHVPWNDPGGTPFREAIDPKTLDTSRAVDMVMEPGMAVFFNERIVHGSQANRSAIPRVALSLRYTTPEARFKVEEWDRHDLRRIKTFLVRGEDRYHKNDPLYGEVPAA